MKRTLSLAAVMGSATVAAFAQSFSVASTPPGSGAPSVSGFSPDDILFPGPLPVVLGAGAVGGFFIDVDAISYGYIGIGAFSPAKVAHYEFSLSTFSGPGAGVGAVATEQASGDHIADIYSSDGAGGNLLLWDGDIVGAPLAGALGLLEPLGDDLDAWDNSPVPAIFGGMFFSVDTFAAFTIYGGAVSPADVLVAIPAVPGYDTPIAGLGTPPGGAVPYALAASIGLDVAGGFGSDNIDALVVLDVAGDFAFTGVGGTDVILFSLTPGSVSLAAPTPYFGATPADILYADSSGLAGIFMPAPALGLTPAADLDALDIKIRQEGFRISADTNGHVTTTWNDLVPPFSYTVEVAQADAPYFNWTNAGSFLAPGAMGSFTDTNALPSNRLYRLKQQPW